MNTQRRSTLGPGPILAGLAAVALLAQGCGAEIDQPTPGTTPTGDVTPTGNPTPTPTPYPEGITVALDGTGDYRSLKEAVDAAQDGDHIRVAPGAYTGRIDFGTKQLVVESMGSPVDTILLGEPCGDEDLACAVVTIAGGQGADTVLRGFTLSGGAGNLCDETVAPSARLGGSRCGGAIYLYGARPTLEALILLGNSATFGGGLAVGGAGDALPLRSAQLVANTASRGGGLYAYGARIDGTHLRIVDNAASILGGGILGRGAGGEIALAGGIVAGNASVLGGGMHLEEIDADLSFLTFAGNTAEGAGGGLNVADDTGLALFGVIFGANEAPQGSALNLGCGDCDASAEYVHLEGGEADLGGAWATHLVLGQWQAGSPDFIGGGDYRLQETSPCADAIPRTQGVMDPDGSAADLGAYGSQLAGLWDLDGDGAYYDWKAEGQGGSGGVWDCDDLNAEVKPGAAEICDGQDSDCSGEALEEERDADGDGALLCGPSEGRDCDDSEPLAYPGAPEGPDGDAIDNDCDGAVDEYTLGRDDDGDGFCEGNGGLGAEGTCADGSAPGDCDDGRAWSAPGLPELCDALDNDCDGVVPEGEDDGDEDGFPPCAGDDNDNNDSIFPGAPEAANDVDDDLDGTVDEGTVYYDDDGDGVCESDGPRCSAGGDCDDTDPAVYPGQPEDACDGVDTDCVGGPGEDELDWDGDGVRICAGDCDDRDPRVYPGAIDVVRNGVDEDCDGWDKGVVGFAWGGGGEPRRLSFSCAQGAGAGPSPWGALILLLLLGRGRPRRGDPPRSDPPRSDPPTARPPSRDGPPAGRHPLLFAGLLFVALLPGCLADGEFSDSTLTPTLTPSGATPIPTEDPTGSPTATYAPTETEDPSATQTATGTPPLYDTWEVKPDGTGDFTRIGDAIAAAQSRDRIHVYEGVYRETLDLGSKALTIAGVGLPEKTLIDASACAEGPCVPVMIRGGALGPVRISRLTLTGGQGAPCGADGHPLFGLGVGQDTCGGGLYAWGADVELTQVLVTGNSATRGGGIFIGAEGDARPALRRMRIWGNTAEEGGGAYLRGSLIEGERVEVTDNVAAGVGGGVAFTGGVLGLDAFIVARNSAPIGAGISIVDGLLAADNGVIADGQAQWGGGVSLGEGGELLGRGLLFAHNGASQGADLNVSCGGCAGDLTYSMIQGGAGGIAGVSGAEVMAGVGVVSGDPLFAPGGYSLSPGSLGVDGGSPEILDADGTVSDMGAYGGTGSSGWDLDGDGASRGQGAAADCDDYSGVTYPAAAEVCDGLDTNCDGQYGDLEGDADGDGVLPCGEVPDCDDDDPSAYPGAEEGAEGDGADNDCDGTVDEATTGRDDDGDGQCEGSDLLDGGCSDGSAPGDCDDRDPDRSGDRAEVCDGRDNDCEGGIPAEELDLDDDGFSPCEGDGDDHNETIFPGAPEEPKGVPDGVDNDQDGVIDEGTRASDDDGDGYCEDAGLCAGGLPGGDCDDADPEAHPGQAERCDGRDTDCVGGPGPGEVDDDGDGVFLCGGDCDDGDAAAYPGAVDSPGDGIDQDCDGWDKGAVGFTRGDMAGGRIGLSCDAGAGGASPWGGMLLLFGLGLLGRGLGGPGLSGRGRRRRGPGPPRSGGRG